MCKWIRWRPLTADERIETQRLPSWFEQLEKRAPKFMEEGEAKSSCV